MTIRKGSNIIAGCLDNSYTAGDWINIDQNNEISAKGSTNIGLVQPNLYCWHDDSHEATVYTTSETPTSPITLYDQNYNELTNVIVNGNSYPIYTVNTFTNQYLRIAYNDGNMILFFDAERKSSDDIVGGTSDEVLPTQKAVKTYVDTKDNNVVHKTGDESINGYKTFLSRPMIFNQLPELNLVDSDVQKGTVPSRWNQGSILYKDKDFNDLVGIYPRYTPEKETRLEFKCYAAQAASNTGYENMVLYGGTGGQGGDGTLAVPSTYPNGTDNTKDLGKSWARWKQLYAGTTSINTSDERVKQGIEPLPDDVLDAWGEVEFYRYKFNDAVEEKGFAKARYHTGMVAQRIRDVFADHGLNAFEYGLLCYDEWEAEPEEKDESDEVIRSARAAGNRYSLRYEECLCMEAAYQRRRADRIEERLKALEEKLK